MLWDDKGNNTYGNMKISALLNSEVKKVHGFAEIKYKPGQNQNQRVDYLRPSSDAEIFMSRT